MIARGLTVTKQNGSSPVQMWWDGQMWYLRPRTTGVEAGTRAMMLVRVRELCRLIEPQMVVLEREMAVVEQNEVPQVCDPANVKL